MRDTVRQALEWTNEDTLFTVHSHCRREGEVLVISFDKLKVPTIPGMVMSGAFKYENLWYVHIFRKKEDECTTTK